MYWLIRFVFFMLLSNSIVTSDIFPNNLFHAKEVWLYLSTVLSVLIASLVVLFRNVRFAPHFLDGLVVTFLLIIPIIHVFIHHDNNVTVIVQQMCIALCYISLRIISSLFHYIVILNLFVQSVLIIFILNVLVGISQYLGFSLSYYPELGPTGIFFNTGPYAIYLSALIPWVLIYILNNTLHKMYISSILGLIASGFAIFLIIISLSRSAWIGLFCGITLPLILFYGKKGEYNVVKRLVIFIMGAALFYLVLYGVKIDSSNGRILIWKVSSVMIREHWQIGIGIGKFSHQYIHYQKKFFEQNADDIEQYKRLAGDVRFAFNDCLQILIEGGILTALLFVFIITSLVFLLFSQFFKKSNDRVSKTFMMSSGVIIGSISVILTAGLTAYPLQVLPISLLFWIQVSLGITMLSIRKSKINKCNKSRINLVVLLTMLNIVVLYYGVQKAKAYIILNKSSKVDDTIVQYDYILYDYPNFLFRVATMFEDKNNVQMALKYMNKAVLYNPSPSYYYKLGRLYENINDIQKALSHYVFVEKAIPNLLKPKYLKSCLYYNRGDTVNFMIHVQEALNFAPKIYTLEVVEMRKDLKSKLKSLNNQN